MKEPLSWKVQNYDLIPREDIEIRTFLDAVLSRVESGSVHWPPPNPRRSFIRGAVYDCRGALIPNSQRRGGAAGDLVLSTNPPSLTPRERAAASEIRKPGRWLYAGNWMQGFGHFLVETLPSLWPLVRDEDNVDGICAHRFTSRNTAAWQFELINLLTQAPVHVVDDQPCTIEELVIGDRPYHYQQSVSPCAADVWDRISTRAAGDNDYEGDPIYISRRKFDATNLRKGVASGREFSNGDDVDALFATLGFRIVHPEELDVLSQIRIVRAAPVIAGQSGSGLHLSVFAKPGAKVIEVNDARSDSVIMGTQLAISAVKKQKMVQIPYIANPDNRINIESLKDGVMDLL